MEFTGKVILAPLAGVSDSVFRRICKRHGADIVVSEMASAEGLVRDSEKTFSYVRFDPEERPLGIQLFGADPAVLAVAASVVQESVKPDFIDLNFGCPVRKVVRRNGGSALLKDPPLMERIIRAVVKAVHLPVTVKIRTGWRNGEIIAPEIARMAEGCGACAITVHGRTQEQGFSGKADWSVIGQVKEAVKIPVIGNGDVMSGEDAARMIGQTGCDSVMVGRGALGRPWIFQSIKEFRNGNSVMSIPNSLRLQISLEHFRGMLEAYGDRKGLYDMRKHFGWYLRALPGAAEARRRIMTEESPAIARQILTEFFERAGPVCSDDGSAPHIEM